MEKTSSRVKFIIDKTGFCAESAVFLLVQAAIYQVIGRWGMWTDRINAIMMIALPVLSCLLLALCVVLFGKKCFFLSSIPVVTGTVFFFFKLLNSTNWVHMVVCILLYLAIVIIYPATVFGWIRTKWLLPPLFGLPLVYHIAVKDLPRLADTANPIMFSDGLQELSILCILAGLMFIGFGLKKQEPEPTVVEPEVVEPAPAPVPEPTPAPAPAPDPEPAPAPAPVQEAAPAPQQESAHSFDPDSYFEPAPVGSLPDLTLDPAPVDFDDEGGAQDSGHEQ